jgi:hypothetical protein
MVVADYDHLLGNGFAGIGGILVGYEVGNLAFVPARGLCGGRILSVSPTASDCPNNQKRGNEKSVDEEV